VCEACDFTSPKEWGDGQGPFRLEPHEYNDQPFGGWAYCFRCNARFAFACCPVIADLLAHWIYVSGSADATEGFEAIFAQARKLTKARWVSVLEEKLPCRRQSFSAVLVEAPMPMPPWEW
jgi:hypothetical protein